MSSIKSTHCSSFLVSFRAETSQGDNENNEPVANPEEIDIDDDDDDDDDEDGDENRDEEGNDVSII